MQAETPNFYWSLVNQVDKSKLSFGLLSTLGCSPDEENNTYGELDPMFVDELIIPYLAEEGMYPYKVSEENEDEEYEEDGKTNKKEKYKWEEVS